MKNLLPEEADILDKRKAGFDAFFKEMMPVLTDFADRLEIASPHLIVSDPDGFLPPISEFLKLQTVEEQDFGWIVTRVGYLIGEILNSRLGGCWFVNEIPKSKYFARYVVGKFSSVSIDNTMVDPFEAAAGYLRIPPPRDLVGFIAEIESECRQ